MSATTHDRNDHLDRESPATVLTSVEQLEELRPQWREIPWPTIDADLDVYETVLRLRPNVVRPHVILLPRRDPPSVFVGRLEDIELATSVGYRTFYRPRARSITLVHGGVTGADTPQTATALVAQLQGSLARGEADVVSLPALRTDSALFAAVQAATPRIRRHHPVEEREHWALRLPDTYEEFVRSRSKKTRENLRVYRNRLARDHGDVTVSVYRQRADVDRLFRDLEMVAAKTYQHGLGVSFADSDLDRELALLGLERGWFRAYVLSVGERPIAFWPGSSASRRFLVGTPGYDPEFAAYSVGTLLLARVIEELCADEAIDVLDFGYGEAEYKRRFGSESWSEADVTIFAPTFRAMRVNATRTGLAYAVRGAKSVAERSGAQTWIRQRWRKRLQRSKDSRRSVA